MTIILWRNRGRVLPICWILLLGLATRMLIGFSIYIIKQGSDPTVQHWQQRQQLKIYKKNITFEPEILAYTTKTVKHIPPALDNARLF